MRSSNTGAKKSWFNDATRLMKNYSERGVFRGQADESHPDADTVLFKLRWHRNRDFRLQLARERRTARVTGLLPGLPSRSAMYREYRKFLQGYVDGSRPPHRSVDSTKIRLVPSVRADSVSLTVQMLDDDYEYALNKLLTVIHETYIVFIAMGTYDTYRVEQLGADPDWGR